MANPFEDADGQLDQSSGKASDTLWRAAYLAGTGQSHAENSTESPAGSDLSPPVPPEPPEPVTMPDVTAGSDQNSQSPLDRGLALLKAGDEKNGIIALMQAAQQNPQLVWDAGFVQTLREIEKEPAPNGNIFASTPTNSDRSIAVPSDNDPSVLVPPSIYEGGLNYLAQGGKVDGILFLMQAAANNPDLLQDQVFFGLLDEAEKPASTQSNGQTNDTSADNSGATIDSILGMTSDAGSGQTAFPSTDQAGVADQWTSDTVNQSALDADQQALLEQGMDPWQNGDRTAELESFLQVVQDDPSLMANPLLISWLDSLYQGDGTETAPVVVDDQSTDGTVVNDQVTDLPFVEDPSVND